MKIWFYRWTSSSTIHSSAGVTKNCPLRTENFHHFEVESNHPFLSTVIGCSLSVFSFFTLDSPKIKLVVKFSGNWRRWVIKIDRVNHSMSQLLKRNCVGLFQGINPKGFNVIQVRSIKRIKEHRDFYHYKVPAGLSKGWDENLLDRWHFANINTLVGLAYR